MSYEVAVIIPFYNEEENLHRSVESVISQNFSNLHIVLVNDASTDASKEKAKKLILENPCRKFSLVSHNENKGLGPSRNSGLDATNAKYVVFLDADDWLKSDNSITTALDAVLKTEADLGVYNHKLVYENGKEVNNPANKHLQDAIKKLPDSIEIKISLLKNHHVAWNKIYKSCLLYTSPSPRD